MAMQTLYEYRNPETLATCQQQLRMHAREVQAERIADYFSQEPDRMQRMVVEGAGLRLDLSKGWLRAETLEHLCALADAAGLAESREAMFSGRPINHTEGRAVLHTALRSNRSEPLEVEGRNIRADISAALAQMTHFCERILSGAWQGCTGQRIRDVVSIGIGGSYLGPKVAVDALPAFWQPGLRCHFVSNIDSADLHFCLAGLDPATTLFIIQSKSFKTQETLTNALSARAWFLRSGASEADLAQHFVAVSSSVERAVAFGVAEDNIFPMWDWVGGRYSLWSAIGLPVALQLGMPAFRELLAGAAAMDEHFLAAPWSDNLPVLLGLAGAWYQDYLGAGNCVILPYDQGLDGLAAHLQQVDMESNGKQVDRAGRPVEGHTGGLVWGGAGTNGQHAYHQLLHQGTRLCPADFILPLRSQVPLGAHHAMLVSNCLAQSQAMLSGKTRQQALAEGLQAGLSAADAESLAAHREVPGNRPNHLITMPELNPHTLGALIAMYEHKVFVQGVLWNLNSFDQWGVELGKQLCDSILPLLQGKETLPDSLDPSTAAAVRCYREAQSG